MEYIAHRASHKYIQKVRTKSGKWRYIYSRPHGRKTGSSSGQAEVHGRDAAFDEYQKWEAQDLVRRDQARKNGSTDEYRTDKVSSERYPWRYTTYAVPADSHNAENSRNRRIAARASTEGRRKEQMAERKTHKNTEKYLNTLYKMPLGWLLKAYVDRSKKKK